MDPLQARPVGRDTAERGKAISPSAWKAPSLELSQPRFLTSRYGCSKACSTVMRFLGEKVRHRFKRSIALSVAFGQRSLRFRLLRKGRARCVGRSHGSKDSHLGEQCLRKSYQVVSAMSVVYQRVDQHDAIKTVLLTWIATT